jgi:hypothetical protein
MARHPLFAAAEEIAIEAEIATGGQFSLLNRSTTQPREKPFFTNQSGNVADNKRL